MFIASPPGLVPAFAVVEGEDEATVALDGERRIAVCTRRAGEAPEARAGDAVRALPRFPRPLTPLPPLVVELPPMLLAL